MRLLPRKKQLENKILAGRRDREKVEKMVIDIKIRDRDERKN